MLNPDRIKPFLLHEDRYARLAATEYFAGSWSRGPEIAPLVLDAYERYGCKEDVWSLSGCCNLLLTGHALDRILDHLGRTGDKDVIASLNRVVATAATELLADRWSAIRSNPDLQPQLIPRLERRGEFAGRSGEKLWEELQDFARRSADKHYAGEIDHSYSDDLVDALARHDVPDIGTVCRLLASFDLDRQGEEGWLELFLVDLAGTRRIAQAIPALVDKFHIDTDFLLERCKLALARIGESEACRLIREAYPTAEDHFRLFTSDVFGVIKHLQSEDASLALLETEENVAHRTLLCGSLCQLFSERGISVVRSQIRDGYDGFFGSLEERLLPVIDVLGHDLPETAKWKEARAEEERRQNARRAEWEEMERRYAELRARGIDPFAKLQQKGTTLPSAPVAAASAPSRRSMQRVGRNDPCLCGSGKKLKKCCGRSG